MAEGVDTTSCFFLPISYISNVPKWTKSSFSLNRTAEAQAVFQQIDLQFLERAGHLLYYGLALNNLGNIAFVQGDYAQAENYLQRSAAIWQEIGYEIELANTLSKLGDVFAMQSMFAAAELHYERVLNITAKYPMNKQATTIQDETAADLEKLRRQKKSWPR